MSHVLGVPAGDGETQGFVINLSNDLHRVLPRILNHRRRLDPPLAGSSPAESLALAARGDALVFLMMFILFFLFFDDDVFVVVVLGIVVVTDCG